MSDPNSISDVLHFFRETTKKNLQSEFYMFVKSEIEISHCQITFFKWMLDSYFDIRDLIYFNFFSSFSEILFLI